MYRSCDGKMCCVYTESTQCIAIGWPLLIGYNKLMQTHIRRYTSMHKINALVYSLLIYIRPFVCALCIHMHTPCATVASVSESNCEYISIVLTMLLHAMYVATVGNFSNVFSLPIRIDFVHKAFFKPFINCQRQTKCFNTLLVTVQYIKYVLVLCAV